MINKVSKSLKEIWDIKQVCYEQVKEMPLKEALKKRLVDSLKSTKKLGYKLNRKLTATLK